MMAPSWIVLSLEVEPSTFTMHTPYTPYIYIDMLIYVNSYVFLVADIQVAMG